jgi:hypothetical protein
VPTPLGTRPRSTTLQVRPVWRVHEDREVTPLNSGTLIAKAWEALHEFGKITAQEFADYADIGRYDAHAALAKMNKRTKAGVKRIYIANWTYGHDDARRYPRAIFMIGDQPDKPRPKPDVAANRRRSESKRNRTFRMNSVFNMAMTRDKIRELRRAL